MTPTQEATDESPDYRQMYVSCGDVYPNSSRFSVYERGIINTPVGRASVRIIGSSHYLTIPWCQYTELMSCFEPDVSFTEYDITETVRGAKGIDGPGYGGILKVEMLDISEFEPIPELYDVWYRFGDRAWTTVTETGSGWETYHTYPEFETAVKTVTEIEEM